MTRKRFVKLMMGLGYSRNEANSVAARANRYGVSYADRWAWEVGPIGSVRRSARKLGKAFEGFGNQIAREIIPGIKKLAETCRALLNEVQDGVKQRLGIRSPSRIQMGVDLANGPDMTAECTIVRPLHADKPADGLRIDWAMIDEMHEYRPGGAENAD